MTEGVETLVQMENLIEVGCTRAQGYHPARPASAALIDDLLGQPVPVDRS